MATLQGTKVKDTYTGLLKTSDAGALTTSLKTVQDGGGNNSALELSTTKVKVEKLEINTPAVTTDTNILTWNATTKSVGYKALSSTASVSVSYDVSTPSEPDLEITDNLSVTKTTGFRGGTNVTLEGATNANGANITINQDKRTQVTVGAGGGRTTADSGKLIRLKASTVTSSIVLPPAAEGLYFEFLITSSKNTAVNIDAASGDDFRGRVVLTSTTQAQSITQVVSGAGNDRIEIESDSATTGGSVGDVIRCHAIDSTTWMVDAVLTTSAAAPTACTTLKSQP